MDFQQLILTKDKMLSTPFELDLLSAVSQMMDEVERLEQQNKELKDKNRILNFKINALVMDKEDLNQRRSNEVPAANCEELGEALYSRGITVKRERFRRWSIYKHGQFVKELGQMEETEARAKAVELDLKNQVCSKMEPTEKS